MHVVNISGRPRDNFLWFGAGSRRARDIRAEELEDLADRGWKGLEGWEVEQVDAMYEDDENQWAMLRFGPDGSVSLEMFFLVDKGEDGWRSEPPVDLPLD